MKHFNIYFRILISFAVFLIAGISSGCQCKVEVRKESKPVSKSAKKVSAGKAALPKGVTKKAAAKTPEKKCPYTFTNLTSPQYQFYRDMPSAGKKALLAKVKFVQKLPPMTYNAGKQAVHEGVIQNAIRGKRKILAVQFAASSLSNARYARKRGLSLLVMTVKNADDAVNALYLDPDYILLDPALDTGKLLSALDSKNFVPRPGLSYVKNYPSSTLANRAPGTDLRILSYNILNQVWAMRSMPPAKERLAGILELIKGGSADIAGLQELDERFWYKLLKEENIAPYRFAGKDYSKNMNAIIYDSRKYLHLEGGVFYYTAYDRFIRNMKWELFQDLKSGKKLIVTNTHWDLTVPKRDHNSKCMVAYMKELQKKFPGVPIVNTGDFNCRMDTHTLKNYLKGSGFADAVTQAPKKENVRFNSYVRHIPGYHLTEKGHIDHVIVSGELQTLEAKLLIGDILCYISDHFPVVADLKYSK